MSRITNSVVIVLAMALILAAGASSSSCEGDLMVPTLLQPGPNANMPIDTPIVFQVQTHPNDYLVLHVSRSPAIVDPERGLIGDDVEMDLFTDTSDPSIYEADVWIETPGTYYWQAHRLEYDGADGAVESEIRSFTVFKPPPPAPRPLAVARVDGIFNVKLTVTSTSGVANVRSGRTYSGRWSFQPRCVKGPCRTKVGVSSLESRFGGWSLTLNRSGAVYKKSQKARILRCSSTPVWGPVAVRVLVTKGRWIDGEWKATKIRGTFKHSVGSTRSGIYRCPAGVIVARIKGTLGY